MSRALPDVERNIAFGSIGASFADLGAALTNNWHLTWIQNLTNQPLNFSWDGADNVNLTLPANSSIMLDHSTNVPLANSEPPLIAIGTQFKVQHTGVAPTSGNAKVNGEFIVL